MRCSYYLHTYLDNDKPAHDAEFYIKVEDIAEKHCMRVRPDKQGDASCEGSS